MITAYPTPVSSPSAEQEALMAEATFHCEHMEKLHIRGSWMPVSHPGVTNKLYIVLGGQGSLMVDDRRYALNPGRVLLLPAGAIQQGESDADDPLYKCYLHFQATSVNAARLMRFLPPPCCLVGDAAEQIRSIAETMWTEWCGAARGRTLALNAGLMRVLLAAYRARAHEVCPPDAVARTRAVSPNDEQYDAVRAALRLIANHYDRPLTVTDLSDEAGLTPNHFSRLFSGLVGTPPMRYVEAIRLRHARAMLMGTAMSVAEVAAHVGYADPNYFSRVFHRQVGMAPSDYRAAARPGPR